MIVGLAALAVATLLFASTAAQKPRGFDVGTVSTVIVPALRPPSSDPFKASTAYSIGDYVKVVPDTATGQHDYYWCIAAGTSGASAPTWTKTNDVTSGTATFAHVGNSRHGVYIQNWSTNSTVYLGFDWPAVYEKGGGLSTSGGSFSMDLNGYEGEITAISSTTATNKVTVQLLP
jgi:hypothetical protein